MTKKIEMKLRGPVEQILEELIEVAKQFTPEEKSEMRAALLNPHSPEEIAKYNAQISEYWAFLSDVVGHLIHREDRQFPDEDFTALGVTFDLWDKAVMRIETFDRDILLFPPAQAWKTGGAI